MTLHQTSFPPRLSVIVLILYMVGQLLTGCASPYMAFDEQGKRIAPEPDLRKYGPTLFHQSVGDPDSELSRLEQIRLYLMYELLKGLAEHDGAGSDRYRMYTTLQDLDVVTDSARVYQIFHNGLMELDNDFDSGNRNSFVDEEATLRAEQILRYHCFLSESVPHFDDLGLLVVHHGVFEIERIGRPASDETGEVTTMTISFANGMNYLIGENSVYEHEIISAGPTYGELTVRTDQITAAGDTDSLLHVMQQYGKVHVAAESAELSFPTVNCHIIPCPYSDGRWNGRAPADKEGSWDYSRALVDFYINLGDVAFETPTDELAIDLDIFYEIYHQGANDTSIVAEESHNLKYSVPKTGDLSDGVSFTLATLPFESGSDSARGDYQLNLRVAQGERQTVVKYPFRVEARRHQLLVLDWPPSITSGIPPRQRIPTARPGDSLAVLIPITSLAFDSTVNLYTGKLELYLTNNAGFVPGRADTKPPVAFQFVDSLGSPQTDLDVATDSASRPMSASAIVFADIAESRPESYVICVFEVPGQLRDGANVIRGTYTLGAVVISGGKVACEAIESNLRVM